MVKESNLNSIPNSERLHIALFGKRNAGKSSILNAICGQDVAVVSNVKGTTTDAVRKNMEFLPLGAVTFIDTAGVDDKGELGELRVKKTKQILMECDFAINVIDATDSDYTHFHEYKKYFKQFNIPYMVVFNKADLLDSGELEKLKSNFNDSVFTTTKDFEQINNLKAEIIERIKHLEEAEGQIIGDLLDYNSKVVLVVPIDSEAPKGRLILPQVQTIRNCLDNGIKSYVVRDTELKQALADLGDVGLVITDSQAFGEVSKIVPQNIKLTSFSILLSRVKGDVKAFVKNVRKISQLDSGAKILVAESCTHNATCDDIGRVKLPRQIKKVTGKDFDFTFMSGKDFPTDLSGYDFVLHCASCMLNRKTMLNRIKLCEDKNIPISNYGVMLAYLNGILDRAIEIIK